VYHDRDVGRPGGARGSVLVSVSRRCLLPLALAACAVLLLTACGGGSDDDGDDSSEPAPASSNPETGDESLAMADARATLQRLLDAVADEDAGKACDQLTDEAKAQLAAIAGGAASADGCEDALDAAFDNDGSAALALLPTAEIGEILQDGEEATAAVTIAGQTAEVRLVEQDGGWLVAGLPGGA
jgi:hypothetical protein